MTLIEQVKSKLIEYDGKDIKRIGHAMKVHSFAKFIAECEGVEPKVQQTIEIASLLHDIGIHNAEEKYGSSAGNYQEIEGPAVAHELMKNLEISDAEKEMKSKRKQVQENLRKFATRIPLFMYLTDEREQTLMDVITKIEPALFKKVTGIEVSDFDKLVHIGVFNSAAMNEAVAAFRRYEESSLSYTGIDKHYGEKVGLWDISIKHEELQAMV